jgi:hypothetical protein
MVVQGNKKDKGVPRSMKMKNIVAGYSTFATSSTSIPVYDRIGYELTIYLTNKTDDMKNNDVHIRFWDGNKPYPTQTLYYDNTKPINTSITGIINELFSNDLNYYNYNDNFSYYDIRRIFIVGVDENIFNTFSFGTLPYYSSKEFVQEGRPNSVVEGGVDFKTKLLSISKDNNNPNNPQVNGWEQKGQNEFYLYVKKISVSGLTPGSTLFEYNVRGR